MTQTIIILGAARSGTKYLRDVLALATNASKVPYDIGYVWRYGSERHPDDALPPAMLTERKTRFIRSQVRRLAKVGPQDGTVVLEKTVGNTLRVPYCKAVFPDAKFVHLIRDGRAVTESAMRQWREPLDYRRLFEKLREMPLQNLGYAVWYGGNVVRGLFSGRGGGRIWGPRYPGIEEDVASNRSLVEICAEQWRASVEATLTALDDLPADRHMKIRYEDLVSGTTALGEVARFCGLEGGDDILSAHLSRVDNRTDSKWVNGLEPTEREQMLKVIGSLLDRLGYTERKGA